jgi:hypothetical protein
MTVKQVRANVAIIKANLESAAKAGVETGSCILMERAKESAPKQTGALANSGFVSKVKRLGSRVFGVVMGFGGPISKDYAEKVHAVNPWFMTSVSANVSNLKDSIHRYLAQALTLKKQSFKSQRSDVPYTPDGG